MKRISIIAFFLLIVFIAAILVSCAKSETVEKRKELIAKWDRLIVSGKEEIATVVVNYTDPSTMEKVKKVLDKEQTDALLALLSGTSPSFSSADSSDTAILTKYELTLSYGDNEKFTLYIAYNYTAEGYIDGETGKMVIADIVKDASGIIVSAITSVPSDGTGNVDLLKIANLIM